MEKSGSALLAQMLAGLKRAQSVTIRPLQIEYGHQTSDAK
jgi:hypothetical protein